MRTKQGFAVQSLIVILILNAIILAAMYLLVGDALQAGNRTVPFLAIGALGTLVLGGAVSLLGRRQAEPPAAVAAPRSAREVATPTAPRPAPEVVTPRLADRVRPAQPTRSAEAGSVQMLAVLQRQGRLIDFLQEDLSMYDDAQIGAAVRTIHEGCRQALAQHVRLEPIFQEAEGSTVTVQPGFDIHAVRLSGDVVGEPPFKGALRHRGWRVASIDLPKPAPGQNADLIVAAAEVEVNGPSRIGVEA